MPGDPTCRGCGGCCWLRTSSTRRRCRRRCSGGTWRSCSMSRRARGSGGSWWPRWGAGSVGTVTYYPDAAAEGLGWPAGWAGLRALGVEPGARGRGVGRALMEACRRRAEAGGADVLCLHTDQFMTAAVAIYTAMGFRRAPAFDFDATSRFALGGVRPVPVLGYRLDLSRRHHEEHAMDTPPIRVGAMYENPVTGERGVVRVPPQEANGHLLVVDLYLRPGGRVAGEHVHPAATESFTPVAGQLAVRHDGRTLHAGPGTRVQVAPGVAHDFWNASAEEVRAPRGGAAGPAPGAAHPPAVPLRPGGQDRRQGPATAAARRRAGPGVRRHHPVHQPAPARPAGAVRPAGPGGPGHRPPRPRPRSTSGASCPWSTSSPCRPRSPPPSPASPANRPGARHDLPGSPRPAGDPVDLHRRAQRGQGRRVLPRRRRAGVPPVGRAVRGQGQLHRLAPAVPGPARLRAARAPGRRRPLGRRDRAALRRRRAGQRGQDPPVPRGQDPAGDALLRRPVPGPGLAQALGRGRPVEQRRGDLPAHIAAGK